MLPLRKIGNVATLENVLDRISYLVNFLDILFSSVVIDKSL